eukprot:403374084
MNQFEQNQYYQQQQQQTVANELVPISQREKIIPTEEEIIVYGQVIGLDLQNQDKHLRWISKYAIVADLPIQWRVFKIQDTDQLIYCNTITNELTQQHPLDPYFQALARRELFFSHNPAQLLTSHFQVNSNSYIPEIEVIMHPLCIQTANETYYHIMQAKYLIDHEAIKMIHEKQEQLERQYDISIQQIKHEISKEVFEIEMRLDQQFEHQMSQMKSQVKEQHLYQINKLTADYEQKLLSAKTKITQRSNNQNSQDNQLTEKIKEIELEYQNKLRLKKKEIQQVLKDQYDQITKDHSIQKQRYLYKLQITYEDREKLLLSQAQSSKTRLNIKLAQKKFNLKKENQTILDKKKQELQRFWGEQLEEMKESTVDQIRDQKKQIILKYKQESLDILGLSRDFKISQEKDLQMFKQEKEQKFKRNQKEIEEEFHHKIEQLKEKHRIQQDKDMMSQVEEYIQQQKLEVQEMKRQVKYLQIQVNGKTDEENQKGQENNKRNQFLTIGDIEQVKAIYPHQIQQDLNELKNYFNDDFVQQNQNELPNKNLSREFNKLQNIKKPPLSRSPTPSKQSNNSQNSSNLTHINYLTNTHQNIIPKTVQQLSQTPQVHNYREAHRNINMNLGHQYSPSFDSSNNVSQQLNFLSENSNSYDLIDSYKMKEIKTYIANELYQVQEKTKKLYDEFNQAKLIKNELHQVNQQTVMADISSKAALVKMKQADHEIEVQLKIIRAKIKNVNDKHEILRKLRDNMRKLQNTVPQKQRQDIEAELLNDYNYLRKKTKMDNERVKRSLNSSQILSQTPASQSDISYITGQTEEELNLQKWEGIIKSGSGQNQNEFNPCAVALLPKTDLSLQSINRLQKALRDLTNMPLSNAMPEQKVSLDFRTRMFKHNQEKQKTQGVTNMIENQMQFLKQIRSDLNKPLELIK